MSDKKIVTQKTALKSRTTVKVDNRLPLFEKDNYLWLGISIAIVAIGMFLMSGGKNPDPNQFDTKLVYATSRITVAPILIIIGFLVAIYAIFKKPKAHS